jgi:hypothetical protein
VIKRVLAYHGMRPFCGHCACAYDHVGKGRGSEQMQLTLADGLSLTLLPDRCLDVAEASFRGIPLASLTPPRAVAPAFADETSTGEYSAFAARAHCQLYFTFLSGGGRVGGRGVLTWLLLKLTIHRTSS